MTSKWAPKRMEKEKSSGLLDWLPERVGAWRRGTYCVGLALVLVYYVGITWPPPLLFKDAPLPIGWAYFVCMIVALYSFTFAVVVDLKIYTHKLCEPSPAFRVCAVINWCCALSSSFCAFLFLSGLAWRSFITQHPSAMLSSL